jgi:hypothetical protein
MASLEWSVTCCFEMLYLMSVALQAEGLVSHYSILQCEQP